MLMMRVMKVMMILMMMILQLIFLRLVMMMMMMMMMMILMHTCVNTQRLNSWYDAVTRQRNAKDNSSRGVVGYHGNGVDPIGRWQLLTSCESRAAEINNTEPAIWKRVVLAMTTQTGVSVGLVKWESKPGSHSPPDVLPTERFPGSASIYHETKSADVAFWERSLTDKADDIRTDPNNDRALVPLTNVRLASIALTCVRKYEQFFG